MRWINYIFIHCTAGYGDVEAIRKFWKALGWKNDGYHFFIYENGDVIQLNPLSAITNGVAGLNGPSIHIAYQGGVNRGNYSKAEDTRTPAQKKAIERVIAQVMEELASCQSTDHIKILGHRDASKDGNGNGKIDSWERIKECPCFDAIPEYMHLRGCEAQNATSIL